MSDGADVPESTPETLPQLGKAEPQQAGNGGFTNEANAAPMLDVQEDDIPGYGDANEGMWPEYCNPSYRMPDEIEVKVKLAAGDYYFPVLITKSNSHKLCGCRQPECSGRI